MEILIWAGSGLTILGVLALGICAFLALRAKRSGQSEAAVKAALQKVIALNLAALFVSAIGLMAVITGIFLA